MKYDDASWHYDGDFPDDLPTEAGATHIGMFVAWAMLNGHAGELYTSDFPGDLESLTQRTRTPGQFLIECCDEKFVDEDLNDEGNAFAEAYFQGTYLSDYEDALAADLPSCYHVADTWENYDRLSVVIDRRFREWTDGKLEASPPIELSIDDLESKPWWKFW